MSEKDLNKKLKQELLAEIADRKICVLDGVSPCNHCGECLMCDLDPDKVCDNCGNCLDTITTDEKGYAKIMIDKVNTAGVRLEDLYKSVGLDTDDE